MAESSTGDGAGPGEEAPGGEQGQVEYLDSAGKGSAAGRRWGPIVALTVGGLAIAAAAAYGVTQYLGGGESPAGAVPDDAFGYLALDLDPGADQQIAAYRFLKKFPALEEELSLTGDEDLRRTIFEEIVSSTDCDDLDFDDDVEPWLGNSVAVAGRMGDDGPEPYVLLAITDRDKAEAGFEALAGCDVPDGEDATTETAEDPGVAFSDEYMVLGLDKDHATEFITDAAESSLADDEDYQSRVEAAGGEGFVTGYLAPSAIDAMLAGMGGAFGGMPGMELSSASSGSGVAGRAGALPRTSDSPSPVPSESASTATELPSDFPTDLPTGLPTDLPTELLSNLPTDLPSDFASEMPMAPLPMMPGTQQLKKYLDDFRGAAMSLRFEDGALELRTTAAGVPSVGAVSDGDSGVDDLPGTTAVAYGIPVSDTFVADIFDSIASVLGDETLEQGLAEVEAQTGLDLRTDLQTLLGDGLSVALDSSADLGSAASGSEEAIEALPVGLRINGDPGEIAPLVDELLALFPVPTGLIAVESGDDAVAVGLDVDYVESLAGNGDLGDQEGFDDALPDFDDGGLALYADLDGEWLTDAIEADAGPDVEEVLANLEPLGSIGLTASSSDDEVTVVLRVTTN